MSNTAPQPQPGILDISPYVPGESEVAGRPEADQALLQRDAARAVAQGDRRLQGPGRPSRALSRRRRNGAAQGHRQALRAQSRAHRVRMRLRRADQSHRARLRRPRRRGGLQRARLPHVQDRHAVERRHTGARGGEGLPRRRGRDAGARDARRPSSSSSPIPTIRPARTFLTTRCGACTRACPATRCWCWMRPTASTCAATTTRPGWSWWRPPRTR